MPIQILSIALSLSPTAATATLAALVGARATLPYEFAGPATAHLFIVSPLRGRGASLLNLLSTHPSLAERVRRLRAL